MFTKLLLVATFSTEWLYISVGASATSNYPVSKQLLACFLSFQEVLLPWWFREKWLFISTYPELPCVLHLHVHISWRHVQVLSNTLAYKTLLLKFLQLSQRSKPSHRVKRFICILIQVLAQNVYLYKYTTFQHKS